MRKLLATIIAVALAMVMILGTAFAGEEELPRNDDGNADITEQIKAAPEGSKLIVTVSYSPATEGGKANSGTAKANYGIGGICLDGNWGVDSDFSVACGDTDPKMGDTLTFTFDVDAIKKGIVGGVQVNFYNGFYTEKIVLQTPDGAGDGKTDDGKTDDGKTDDGKGSETPKTGDTMTVVLLAGVAILALGAVVVTKKARA